MNASEFSLAFCFKTIMTGAKKMNEIEKIEELNLIKNDFKDIEEFLKKILSSDEKDEKHHVSLIDLIKLWLTDANELLSKPQKEVTNKEIESIQERYKSITLLKRSYPLNPRYYLNNEELVYLLPALNLTEQYKKFHDELYSNGFERMKIRVGELLNKKAVWYRKSYNCSVVGDHSTVVLAIDARIDENGLKLVYENLRISEYYLVVSPKESASLYLEDLKKFIKRNSDYIDLYRDNEITVDSSSVMEITVKDGIRRSENTMLKLAILLDKEVRRDFPFELIEGYQDRGRLELQLLEEEFNEEDRERLSWNEYMVLRHVIQSDFSMSKEKIIETFKYYTQRMLDFYKKRESNNMCEEIKENTDELINELENMSHEEYICKKYDAFDLT